MEEKNKELLKTKQEYSTKIFLFGIESIFYFGGPAALGVLLGNWISEKYQKESKEITILILFFTYILSWVLFYFRFKAIKKKYNK